MNAEKENIIRVLARYRVMCPFLPFIEILQAAGVPNYERFENIEKSPLFKELVLSMQKEIDDSIVEQGSIDPVLVKLKIASVKAAERLMAEVDNLNKESEGATASTRIIASNSILQLLGYGGKNQKDGTTVRITISEKQAASISISDKPVPEQPKTIGENDL